MKFHFDCKIGPWDFWLISMRKTYSSPVGLCNIIFTLAMVALTKTYFNRVNDWVQLLLIFLCLIFPVFQPVFVYFKAKSQTALIPQGMSLDVDNSGILVSVGAKNEKIKWARIHQLIEEKSMLIIRVDGNSGYFLTNRALKDQRESFKSFAESMIG